MLSVVLHSTKRAYHEVNSEKFLTICAEKFEQLQPCEIASTLENLTRYYENISIYIIVKKTE